MKQLPVESAKAFCLFCICLATACITAGCKGSKETPRIVPREGLTLPAIKSLAWLGGEDTPGCFVSVSEDGAARVWDIYSGFMENNSLRHEDTGETDLSQGVQSPDGTMTLFAPGDGSVSLANAATGEELARYYGYGSREEAGEWISISPAGFHNASWRGNSILDLKAGETRYSLAQLSGALFRPDLFRDLVAGEKPELPLSLDSLIAEERTPPLVSQAEDRGAAGEPLDEAGLVVKITEQGGGAGLVAVYRRAGGREIPAGLFPAEKAAEKTYTEKDKSRSKRVCYEIRVKYEHGDIGVSAFNKDNTVESGIHWFTPPHDSAGKTETPAAESPPVLRALLASGEAGRENTGALEDSLLMQEEGDLYRAVDVKSLLGEDFSRMNYIPALEELCSGSGNNDVVIIYLRGGFGADSLGDLRVAVAGESSPESAISAAMILEHILPMKANSLFLMDLEPDVNEAKLETALLRFRHRLGPKAMLASFMQALPPHDGSSGDGGYSAIQAILRELNPDLSGANSRLTGNTHASAAELLGCAGETLAEQGNQFSVFLPMEDFRVTDRLINSGELRFQTMASGMLKIDRVDAAPLPLTFGATMIRTLPPGSYIIDMIYRNGYRETRMVKLRRKESQWVTFNYVPSFFEGDISAGAFRALPSLGINMAELNPANYQTINREAMEGMGMAPYYVAFLAGEKLYREGSYDKAIAEYGRSISLKADYAEAYVSRGNARRRKGDLDRAVEDYSRALGLKSGYAEVYNYRGFVYAQKGDYGRAIADYTQAIRFRADYTDAFFNRAWAYGKQANWDRAIADYTQVIKNEPSNAAAYNERANAWRSKGDETRAAADCEAAKKLANSK